MRSNRRPISALVQKKHVPIARRIGIIAILLSLLAAPFSLLLAAVPLLLFIVLCFAAPFVPGVSFFLPIISRGQPGKHAVALTFDDGPDPGSTPALLHLLSKYGVKATFYVTGRRAEQYPHLIREMVSHGHTIGNHTYSHDNFIMLKSAGTLKKEIHKAQSVLHRFGVLPLTFRPPVGVTSPRLGKVLNQLGLYTVNFNRRSGDMGNRRVTHISKKILDRLNSGDIIMLHDNPTRNEKMYRRWLTEIDLLLSGIEKKNLKIVPLAELIERPIMANPETVSEDNSRF